MKNLLLCLLVLVSSSLISSRNIEYINCEESEVPNWSEYAAKYDEGDIIVAAVGTHWCAPCKLLKKQIKEKDDWPTNVRFLLVDMSYPNLSYKKMMDSDGYLEWRTRWRLREWPHVIMWIVHNKKPYFVGYITMTKEYLYHVDPVTTDVIKKKQMVIDRIDVAIDSTNQIFQSGNMYGILKKHFKNTKHTDVDGKSIASSTKTNFDGTVEEVAPALKRSTLNW